MGRRAVGEGGGGGRDVKALSALQFTASVHRRLLLCCTAWDIQCYVMNKGLPPLPIKKIKKASVSVLFSIFCPLSISALPLPPHHQPPPTLTLACLSGLLPCIPPFPVWPLSQEVAQLVDKHHAGDGEEG